jgi:hypothetical protein
MGLLMNDATIRKLREFNNLIEPSKNKPINFFKAEKKNRSLKQWL